MKMKKLLVAFLALTMLATGMISNVDSIQAAGAPLKIAEDVNLVVKPGETTHVKIPIQATDTFIPLPTIELSAGKDAPFIFSVPKLTSSGVTVNSIGTGSPTMLEFDVTTKESASINNYPLNIIFTYSDYFNGEADPCTLSTILKVQEEKVPVQLTISNVALGNDYVGSNTTLSFTVKNEGELTGKNIFLNMNYGEVILEGYTAKDIKIGDLASGQTKDISLPITILSSAGAGRKALVANFSYKTVDGDALKSSYNIYVNLSTNVNSPKLTIDNIDFKEGLKPGDSFDLSIAMINLGAGTAKNIMITIDPASMGTEGILKDYYTDGITVTNIKRDKNRTVKIPLKVSKYATGGLKPLKVIVTYTDDIGVSNQIENTVYIDVAGEATAGSANLVISGVNQSPASPLAGERMEVSFYVENKSSVDVTDLKISTEGLTSSTFIPVESEPYQYIEKLKGGEKVKITIPLIVSDSITEGLNNLTVAFEYAGMTGENKEIIPIRNVQNDIGTSSKPKLIVSKYITDTEELRAGSTFNFTFDIYNTNASVAAKNITITVSQPENIYTVTQGSNSFFINKIDPGETVSNTLEMKVKTDATTKAYPVEILIEYEYDGAEPNPTTGEIGESKKEILNLQAIENSRPVVDYVNVYSYDGMVMMGSPAFISFEFYNMGRSPLNNVIVRLEGDGFSKLDGDMTFIGTVAAGGSSYVEFQANPNFEGTANGVLKITFEDSNGDEVEYLKEFSWDVMPANNFDPGVMEGDVGEVFNPEVPTAKKEILPVWLFVIILVVVFILFVPITRAIIINVYKSKLRKRERDQY